MLNVAGPHNESCEVLLREDGKKSYTSICSTDICDAVSCFLPRPQSQPLNGV